MLYPFYQRLMPVRKLIKVGDYEVPDGKPVWLVPTPRRISIMLADASDPYPMMETRKEHRYIRQKTITGDIFVAEVTVEQDK